MKENTPHSTHPKSTQQTIPGLQLTFLGVRGSTPCANWQYAQYGGHTSCVMVEAGETRIFLDAGSGLFDANDHLGNHQGDTHILLSHAHFDHIMGLPYLRSVWNPNQNIHIYAGNLLPYGGTHQVLQKAFSPPFFPVSFDSWPAFFTVHDITPGDRIDIAPDVYVATCSLQHPNGATAYRIHYQGKSVCYVTDTEHVGGEPDANILTLIHGTDLFIYDASYTDESYPKFKGWGHSTWQEACRLGVAAQVKHTALFHHDPYHSDEIMQAIDDDVSKNHPHVSVIKQGTRIII